MDTQQLQKLNEVTGEIQTILQETENLVIVDRKTYKGVRSGRTRVQHLISDIEARRVELKAPVLEAERLIDSTAKGLTAPLKNRKWELIEKIRNYDEQKKRERLEKQLKEAARKLAITEMILKYRDSYLTWIQEALVENLPMIIEALEKDTFTKRVYQEFLPKIIEERDLLITMVKNQITSIQEKELEAARQAYRTYFESPECPPELTIEQIHEVIHIAEEKFQADELARAHTAFAEFFGIEPLPGLTTSELLETIEIGKELRQKQDAMKFDVKKFVEETNARIEKEIGKEFSTVPDTPGEAFVTIERAVDEHCFESYLYQIQTAVNDTPAIEWDELVALVENIKKDVTEVLVNIQKVYQNVK